MSKFKVGDKVRVKEAAIDSDKIGQVLCVEKIEGGHVWLEGCKTYWDTGFDSLELVTSKSTIMSKVSVMMKKLLDTDTQKLVKAGFINGDLMLTSSGKDALDAILFESNKKALVAAAEEVIKEEEESKK